MRSTAMKRTSALFLTAGLVFGLAACGDDSDDTSTEGTGASSDDSSSDDSSGDGGAYSDPSDAEDSTASGDDAATGATITISGSTFSTIEAVAGEPVTITNEDGFSHTVASDDDSWDEVSLSGDDIGEIPGLDAGSYEFHCNIHRTMTGTLTVA